MAQPRLDNRDEGGFEDRDDTESRKATLVEHLDELRSRIMRSLFFLCCGWGIGWYLEPPIYHALEGFLNDPKVIPPSLKFQYVFDHFTEAFFLKFKLSFIIGLILAAPAITWQLWGFVRPALKRNEVSALRKVVPASIGLFVLGVAMAVLIMRPALSWFVGYISDFAGAALFQNPGSFAIFILKMVFAFGLGFELPVVVWFLAKIGLFTSEALWKQWRIAVGAIVVISFFLTPGGDIFSNTMLAVPLLLMYFITIAVIRIGEKRRKRRGDDYYFE